MADALVPGFRTNIRLLPHQVIGRAWMRTREDLAEKRAGGILADDMGLGKTIQMLARIVDDSTDVDRSDEDGWDNTTLIVCPLALIGQWSTEIEKMADGVVVIKHHGTSRTKSVTLLRGAHIVITTYETVRSEHDAFVCIKPFSRDSQDLHPLVNARAPEKEKSGALFKVQWRRVVLDEAHNIRNRNTKIAVACCQLQAKFRWCLTGTPMQNNIDELFSLFKFLRIKPLNDWEHFNNQIAKPVKSGDSAGRAMKRLQVVLQHIMLRRMKTQRINGKPLIELPPRIVNIVSCTFDSSERAFYSALEGQMQGAIKYVMHQKGSGYMGVLLLLLRLRQACDHPSLISQDCLSDLDTVNPGRTSNDPDADDLTVTFTNMKVTEPTCGVCIQEMHVRNSNGGERHCRVCAPLVNRASADGFKRTSSSKIRVILRLLKEIEQRSHGKEKTIIFSQFTSMLDLIGPFLRQAGMTYVRYDGSMNLSTRDKALSEINNNPDITVILISFKAGGTGLNLTACNNVIMVDLWWNPALEDQAFDRAHRLGQTRPVNIFKLKIDNTVEDRILALQDQKRQLAQAALSGHKTNNTKLGLDDLLGLFRPFAVEEADHDDL
ncbi:SNF2 family N-terminal domain-containing protein [Mycena vitilis]|nr:SNF2 family N-terminal domain-containing protein [Mycena vitilis]